MAAHVTLAWTVLGTQTKHDSAHPVTSVFSSVTLRDSVRTAQSKPCVQIVKTNQIILYTKSWLFVVNNYALYEGE